MNKAEDRAFEAYPPKMRYVGIDSVKYDRKIDVNKPMRERYVKAYHQAEKDLELTWEDMKCIYLLVISVSDMQGWKGTDKSIYQEVLKKFKERKNKINKNE